MLLTCEWFDHTVKSVQYEVMGTAVIHFQLFIFSGAILILTTGHSTCDVSRLINTLLTLNLNS